MYNFIISYQFIDLYYYLYRDIESREGAYYVDAHPTCLTRQLRRIILSELRIPFKSWLRKALFKYTLREWTKGIEYLGSEICFIIQPRWLYAGMDEYIRSIFPKAKFVCLFTDLVSAGGERRLLLEKYREKADLIFTFDREDAKKYDLLFQPTPYSKVSDLITLTEEKTDLCFVGQDKGRLQTIVRIADNMNKNGIRCDFHLIRVPLWKRQKVSGITYHNTFFSYKKCLNISAGSKCILEIVQKGSSGNTIRIPEAILLGKKVISNNKHLPKNYGYVSDNMQIFNEPEDIDIEFIKSKCIPYSKEFRDSFSPIMFLDRIISLLADPRSS